METKKLLKVVEPTQKRHKLSNFFNKMALVGSTILIACSSPYSPPQENGIEKRRSPYCSKIVENNDSIKTIGLGAVVLFRGGHRLALDQIVDGAGIFYYIDSSREYTKKIELRADGLKESEVGILTENSYNGKDLTVFVACSIVGGSYPTIEIGSNVPLEVGWWH